MTAPVVTLANGEVVPSNSLQWRDECFNRWQRVVQMRAMDIHGRRALLAQVEGNEGAVARQRLEAAFRDDWGARKGDAR